ncbi:MAG: hypothetical protein QNJ33_16975 [Crocosphaera sp.]|nr:hypothetical protein [Crocosphaera sp.]
MDNPQNNKQQQYQRLQEIFNIARQRYLDDGGNPHHSGGGVSGKDYLTDAEKEEIRLLGNQVFGETNSLIQKKIQ